MTFARLHALNVMGILVPEEYDKHAGTSKVSSCAEQGRWNTAGLPEPWSGVSAYVHRALQSAPVRMDILPSTVLRSLPAPPGAQSQQVASGSRPWPLQVMCLVYSKHGSRSIVSLAFRKKQSEHFYTLKASASSLGMPHAQCVLHAPLVWGPLCQPGVRGAAGEFCHTRVCFNPICAYYDAPCRIKCRAFLQWLAMHRLPKHLQSPDLLRMSVPSRSLVSSLRSHCSIQHLPCNLQSQSSTALYSNSSRYASHQIQALSQRMLFLSSCQFLQKSCSRRRLPCNMQP